MKIIFLDVDGVLNNESTDTYTKAGVPFVNNALLSRLKEIVDATSAKIVLCSSWREGWYEDADPLDKQDYNELADRLAKNGTPIYSVTERARVTTKKRGDEITDWLLEHQNESIENYVILDDAPSTQFPTHFNHLITVNYLFGLTSADTEWAITLLN